MKYSLICVSKLWTSVCPCEQLGLFKDAPFIPDHDTITCYQLTWFKQVFLEHSTTQPASFVASVPAWLRHVGNKKNNETDEIKHWIYCLIFNWVYNKKTTKYHLMLNICFTKHLFFWIRVIWKCIGELVILTTKLRPNTQSTHYSVLDMITGPTCTYNLTCKKLQQ